MTEWQDALLGDLCTIQSGSSNTQDADPNGEFAFFDRSKTPKRSNRYLLDCEAVIIAGEGAEFRPKKYVGKFDLHQRAYAIHGFGSHLLGDYLFYYLEHIHTYFQKVAVGATVKSLRQRHFENLPVTFPKLITEQQRIVGILDQAFEGIAKARANAEQNLANAKELFESERESLFAEDAGADERGFDEICDITSTLVDPREAVYQPMLHIGAGNIESHTGKLSNVQSAADEKLISGKFIFDDSMVLYSKIRPYLKKVVAPDFSGLCSADIYPLTPTAGVMQRDYLYHMLLTKRFTNYAISGSDRAGMPKVNRTHLFAYKVGVPSIARQMEVIDRLQDVRSASESLLSNYKTRIRAVDELKSSILHQAFSGNL